jgi:hypothetical protein
MQREFFLHDRLAAERGIGIIEVVIAAAVFLVISAGVFAMLVNGETRTHGAEHHEAAISLAQREVERMRQGGYAELGMTASPVAAAASGDANPSNPAEYVSGGNLLVRSNFRDRGSAPPPGVPVTGEPFVAPLAGGIDPAPQRLTAGGFLFDVHRYVTWADLSCVVGGTDRCPGPRDAKRLVVAVRPAPERWVRAGALKPLWISTVLTDPTIVASGATPPTPPPDPTSTAQHFYLYDTPCDNTVRQPLTGSHAAHDTGSSLDCTAENPPDLMGPARTPTNPDGTEPAMFDYSLDYPDDPVVRTGGAEASGLGLRPPTSSPSCPTGYAASTATDDKHRVHRWLTAPMPVAFTFTSTTRSAMTVWTRAVAGIAGEATLCVAMHKVSAAGQVVGGPLATATHRIESWPTGDDATQISFAFNHSGTPPAAFSLTAGERLLLTLSLANSSLPGGIELFYDHPTYDTVLSVGTTTPLP